MLLLGFFFLRTTTVSGAFKHEAFNNKWVNPGSEENEVNRKMDPYQMDVCDMYHTTFFKLILTTQKRENDLADEEDDMPALKWTREVAVLQYPLQTPVTRMAK